jgi:hypothetical protein
VLGAGLVAAGLTSAYLTLATPLVAMLVPASQAADGVAVGLGAWSFSLIFGGALLASGTSRLALAVAVLRAAGRHAGGPAARALSGSDEEIVVANAIIPNDGLPVPEVIVGTFGVAVVHELPPATRVRQVRGGWEARSGGSWRPMADPLEATARDAERIRRWLNLTDLDFVVRVSAALIVTDADVARTPNCAVLRPNQMGGWLASLPRQRTLTPGRRGRLVAMIRGGR